MPLDFIPPSPRQLAFSRITTAPAVNSTTSYTDTGLSSSAVAAQPVETWLRLFVAGFQSGSTNAITFRIVTNDANLTVWHEQTILLGDAFDATPTIVEKRIPASTAIPGLKLQYKSGTAGQNAAMVTPTSAAPESITEVAFLLIERRR